MAAKTREEMQTIFKQAKQSVRAKAKAAGAPLFYFKNGKRIREDSDGRKFVLVIDSDGKQLEYPVG